MSTLLSPARAKSRFRFDQDRDDHTDRVKTCRVLTTSSLLMHGGDCGVFGSPLVVLTGYGLVEGTNKLNSVRRVDGLRGFISGRAVELTMEELARLDQFAELTGEYHRFLAKAKGPQGGTEFDVWVYQLLSDAGPVELAASATAERPLQAAA